MLIFLVGTPRPEDGGEQQYSPTSFFMYCPKRRDKGTIPLHMENNSYVTPKVYVLEMHLTSDILQASGDDWNLNPEE